MYLENVFKKPQTNFHRILTSRNMLDDVPKSGYLALEDEDDDEDDEDDEDETIFGPKSQISISHIFQSFWNFSMRLTATCT